MNDDKYIYSKCENEEEQEVTVNKIDASIVVT